MGPSGFVKVREGSTPLARSPRVILTPFDGVALCFITPLTFSLKRNTDTREGTVDIHILMAERRRLADEFRSKLMRLSQLRGQLVSACTDESRQHLYAAVDDEAAIFHDLGDKLLELDASILALQTREAAGARLGGRLSVEMLTLK